VISVEAAFALVIVVVLFATLLGLIFWARGGSPYDDGAGASYAAYLPEPMDDEGWAEPPPRTKPPWERDREPTIDGVVLEPTESASAAAAPGPAAEPTLDADAAAPDLASGRGSEGHGEHEEAP
jgi:hypothetical protein